MNILSGCLFQIYTGGNTKGLPWFACELTSIIRGDILTSVSSVQKITCFLLAGEVMARLACLGHAFVEGVGKAFAVCMGDRHDCILLPRRPSTLRLRSGQARATTPVADPRRGQTLLAGSAEEQA
jgi:hypothetical protein